MKCGGDDVWEFVETWGNSSRVNEILDIVFDRFFMRGTCCCSFILYDNIQISEIKGRSISSSQ